MRLLVALRGRLRPGEDPRAWRASVGIAFGFTCAAAALFWFGSGPWIGALHAGFYGDIAQLTGAASDITHGHLGDVYGSNIGLLALPLSFVAVLPLAPLLGWLHQPVPYHDLATLMAGSYILALSSVALHAVRRLLWEAGVRRGLLAAQLLAAVLVLLPELEYGHFDDVLALSAVLYAVRRLLRSEPLGAALWISVAISCKQWAFMLLPLLWASAPRNLRARVVAVSVGLPAVLTVVSIGFDGSGAFHAFFSPLPSSQLTGHPGFDPNWLGSHSSEASRAIAAALACVLGIRLSRSARDPARLFAAVSAILLIRPLTETVNYSYYWSPTLLFAVAAAAVASGDRSPTGTWAWIVAALAWSVPRGLDSSPSGWWACQLVILLAAGISLRRVLRRHEGREREFPPLPATLPLGKPALPTTVV